MKKRVAVGLSGGVDSSVAAYLLKEQGYDVVGVFMKNWNDGSVAKGGECAWVEDSTDALIVAQQLSIPFQVIDLSEPYRRRIVDYMFDEYRRGRTPNPDIRCNREIKFDSFALAAIKIKADFLATGHYCRKAIVPDSHPPTYRLLAGKDDDKDQSYFLCQLTQEQLSKALFPIGGLTKTEVRAIAKRQHLITATKKDSQGLCFVGKVHLPVFLEQHLSPRKGKIVEVPRDALLFQQTSMHNDLTALTRPYPLSAKTGRVVGEHEGAYRYTIGQRKGLQLGGYSEPLFVIGLDTEENIVYVGQGDQHPGLYRRGLFVSRRDEHWVRPDLRLQPGGSKSYSARIRYRQPLTPCRLTQQEEGLYVVFDTPQRGIAPGQFVAWYDGEELIGSGAIS